MSTAIEAVRDRSVAVDRNRVDMTWERLQEQAMHAFQTNDASQARVCWARALEIAERHFERGDPRLAASRCNHAFALMRQNQLHQANLLYRQAITAWEDSWCWVPWMTPSAGDGETDVAPYDQKTQDAFYALVNRGKAITEMMWQERCLPQSEGDDWSSVKPKGMNDVRRLFAAVFLMPTARPQ